MRRGGVNAEERSVKITIFSSLFFLFSFVSAYVSKRTKHQRTDDLAFLPILRGNLFVRNSFILYLFIYYLCGVGLSCVPKILSTHRARQAYGRSLCGGGGLYSLLPYLYKTCTLSNNYFTLFLFLIKTSCIVHSKFYKSI